MQKKFPGEIKNFLHGKFAENFDDIKSGGILENSVADPERFDTDPDPTFYVDTDLGANPSFQFKSSIFVHYNPCKTCNV